MKKVVIGGGCFWGVQEYYRRLKGVYATRVGYAQGVVSEPTYEIVKKGDSGYIEVCEIEYNEEEISLLQIVEHLFRFIDPYQKDGQAHDLGTQYQSGIFVFDNEDLKLVRDYVQSLPLQSVAPVTTRIELLKNFYEAEDYHQQYLLKNPNGYCHVDFSKIKEEEMK